MNEKVDRKKGQNYHNFATDGAHTSRYAYIQ